MKQLAVVLLLVCLCGCQGLRYAAAETVASENVSQALFGLAESAHDQSGAFVFDYGLPQDRPVMKGVDAGGNDRGSGTG